MVSTPVQGNQRLSVTYGTDGTKIASGSTTPGATNWQVYSTLGIYVEIDTSAAGFTKTPAYVISLAGGRGIWVTIGNNSIYEATEKSFRVYMRWDQTSEIKEPPTPEFANSNKWHINWIAIEPSTTPFPDPQKYYYLVAKHSGKGLAVYSNSNDNNARIVQWEKAAQGNHQFRFQDAGNGYFYIIAKHSGKGLAVSGVSNDNNAKIVQYDIGDQGNHQFRLQDAGDGYFYIVAKHSGKSVVVSGINKDNNADIVQWDIVAQDNHKWKLEVCS